MKLDLSPDSLYLIEEDKLVDKFISDVLLPNIKYSHRTCDIYEVFLQYCETIEVGPVTLMFFSRHLRKRFQRRRVNGNYEFFCIVKPELIVAE